MPLAHESESLARLRIMGLRFADRIEKYGEERKRPNYSASEVTSSKWLTILGDLKCRH